MTPRAAIAWVMLAALATAAPGLAARTTWRTVAPRAAPGQTCLEIGAHEQLYTLLAAKQPVVLQVAGPRRLRIITRHVGAPAGDNTTYTLVALLDGREVLRKRVTSRPVASARPCGGDGAVTAARTSYLDLPAGEHEVRVLAETAGGGQVAGRFFRESRRQRRDELPFAPEHYVEARRLVLETGAQSTAYYFRRGQPLRFTVKGPTSLKLYTRVDFDHTAHGLLPYVLEVSRDGGPAQVYHYEARKQDGAVYLERPAILPGERKLLRIAVPKGTHRYTVRCMRPDNCGVTAQIRIPRTDIGLP